jgi:hypothetical protein
LAAAREALGRVTGVRPEGDGTFSVAHGGQRLREVCPDCLAVIAGQALQVLPAEQQRVLVAASPEGARLVQAARQIAEQARSGHVEAAAMETLAQAAEAFPSRRQMRQDPLARMCRAGQEG